MSSLITLQSIIRLFEPWRTYGNGQSAGARAFWDRREGNAGACGQVCSGAFLRDPIVISQGIEVMVEKPRR